MSKKKTDRPRSLLLNTIRYGPYIITGSHHRRGQIYTFKNNLGCYSLWALKSGTIELTHEGEKTVYRGPSVLFLEPAYQIQMLIPGASEVRHLEFDVIYRPAMRDCYRGPLPKKLPLPKQPSPEEIWGIKAPPVVPRSLHAVSMTTVRFCCGQYWRSALHYAYASARLGQWLIELMLHHGRGQRPTGEAWVDRIERMARDLLSSNVNVSDLASMAGMSRQHFSMKYKKVRGYAPAHLLKELKMDLAAQLLTTSDRSVAGIAAECGYLSTKTFSLQFHSHYGCSPRDWRRDNQT